MISCHHNRNVFSLTQTSRIINLFSIITFKITPHVFRHTHTSLLAEANVPLHEIMDRLGHQDDTTTRKVYLHVTKDKKKDASQKFAKLLQGISS